MIFIEWGRSVRLGRREIISRYRIKKRGYPKHRFVINL